MDAKLSFRMHSARISSNSKRRWLARLAWCLVLAVGVGLAPLSQGIAQSAATEHVVIVAPGDTLSELAERHGTTTDALVRSNGLGSRDFIRVGQRLVVGVENTAPTAPEVPAATAMVHVVQVGDTVISIAGGHGVSVESIAAANNLANPNRILVGQTLRIPGNAPVEREPDRPASSRGDRAVDGSFRLNVPYRTQFTSSPYSESDCGPATLGMMLDAYGKAVPTTSLRQWVMESTRNWGYDGGSDWKSLVYASKKAGFEVDGLYNSSGGYRKWSFDDLVAQLKAGNPVMPLVRYRALPGHTTESWWGDHYIAIVGIGADGQFIYHDSAFRGQSAGANRTMSRDTLQRAWSSTSVGIAYSAMILKK